MDLSSTSLKSHQMIAGINGRRPWNGFYGEITIALIIFPRWSTAAYHVPSMWKVQFKKKEGALFLQISLGCDSCYQHYNVFLSKQAFNLFFSLKNNKLRGRGKVSKEYGTWTEYRTEEEVAIVAPSNGKTNTPCLKIWLTSL